MPEVKQNMCLFAATRLSYTSICCIAKISRGAFSVVKKCVKKENGQEFAVKIITTKRLTSRG